MLNNPLSTSNKIKSYCVSSVHTERGTPEKSRCVLKGHKIYFVPARKWNWVLGSRDSGRPPPPHASGEASASPVEAMGWERCSSFGRPPRCGVSTRPPSARRVQSSVQSAKTAEKTTHRFQKRFSGLLSARAGQPTRTHQGSRSLGSEGREQGAPHRDARQWEVAFPWHRHPRNSTDSLCPRRT